MGHQTAIEDIITSYFKSNVEAISTLYEKNLHGQMLILIFSSIDSMGLLNAPGDQVDSTGESFKKWVKDYLLQPGNVSFTDTDLWAARCSVLHTFTAESRLSRDGKAKQLKYYGGDKESAEAKRFVEYTNSHESGKHLAVNFEDLYLAYLAAIHKFIYSLDDLCRNDKAYESRLRKVLMTHSMKPAP